MTIEDKAKAYADRYEAKPMAETAIRAYIAGHFEAPQWVSVEERLPEEGQEVLLYDVNSIRHYVIGWRRKKGDNKSMWALSNGFVEDKDITHWLPIPPLKGVPDTFNETDK